MIIGIDFDGTCVVHEYPKVGADAPGAERLLLRLISEGHQLILWTMRSGEQLKEAVAWFMDRDILLFGVNENPDQKGWTDSPKVYCHLYIDDAALGCPLVPAAVDCRACVDWSRVQEMLKVSGVL